MPKTVTTSEGRAAEPFSEIDELADDPALQPRPPSDPTRLAKVPRRRKSVKSSAGPAADGTGNDERPPRSESHKQKKRAKSTSRDAEGGSSEAAPTAGAARLARFRYAGPSAGSHQRIDPTTLEDFMASRNDPVEASPACKPTNRPPKRPLVQEQPLASPSPPPLPPPPKKQKKRTLSASNENGGPLMPSRPTKTAEEPVFVMPEFDEDGNLIEDENENSLAPASSSRDAARPPASVRLARTPRPPTKASSPEAFAAAVDSSPAGHRLPSSIELPNSLAQRIYGDSPSDRKQVISGAMSACDVRGESVMMSDAGHTRRECSSSLAAKPKAPAPPTPHPLLATPRKNSTAQASPFRPAKKQPNTPKVLSSADLLAVAEVLAGLDSQALDDLDALDDDFKLVREGNVQPSAATCAAETANLKSNNSQRKFVSLEPTTAPIPQALVTGPQIAPSSLGKAPATTRVDPAAKQIASAPIETTALPQTSSSTLRFDPKPLRLPPSPAKKRPASYRLVSNSLEGALAHLKTVVAEATEQADSGKRHEVDYLRGEVSRLATELESRDAAIGELADEVRDLRTRLEEAQRREDEWEGERQEWARERQEWEMRVDVLREIRRGLLDQLTELQATTLSNDTAGIGSDGSTPIREIGHAEADEQPRAFDATSAGDRIANSPEALHGDLTMSEQPKAPGCEA